MIPRILPSLLLLFALLLPCQAAARDSIQDPAALPVAIDVGHSEPRWGATSARGVKEYHFNKALALIIRDAMHAHGLTAAFLLDSGNKRRSPAQRARLARDKGAVLLLSVHHDSVQPHYLEPWNYEGRTLRLCNRFQGYSLFYSEKNPKAAESLQLAADIGAALRLANFTPTDHHAEPIKGENRDFVDPVRGVYRFDDLIVLKSAPMPAVLMEAGVILNSLEENLLRNPQRQERMATAVTRGVMRFLGLAPAEAAQPFAGPRLQR